MPYLIIFLFSLCFLYRYDIKKKEKYNVRAGKRSVLAGVRMGKVLSTMGPHTGVLFMIGFLCKVLCCAVLACIVTATPADDQMLLVAWRYTLVYRYLHPDTKNGIQRCRFACSPWGSF